ncbi:MULTISPECIES: hypothetical protein [unclassified Lysobacter]|uniref:hypothetical protein n=1 Tax=unclassified Lysobacter TaxID=2635362 RepID=UPI0006FBF966|nr:MULTISPECIES: hypothetical protein [unclassified Lysobacter]KRA16109.1 hypothetical protein ASD69_15355 [Lysobacter sp. Root604]KRD31810.1 hypothetical protein ASE35_12580 [Lysobacter sp. Root916]KRD75679.1 hypothetical protein ASE43_12580 [Lysobacter sp. Root983]
MIVSVFNLSHGAIGDLRMQEVIRAINIQIERDFEPYWGFGATLRLEGHTARKGKRRFEFEPLDMRGDGVLYVLDKFNKDLAGAHETDFRGVPAGVVYLDLSKGLQEDWTVSLSHEALEMIADPQVNLVVQGPHPEARDRDVFHWFEMCDAVQAQSYAIDGVGVSDFVLPLYFTPTSEPGSRNNFMGAVTRGKKSVDLPSFGVAHGGYIGYFDPRKADNLTYEHEGDTLARKRRALKQGRTGRRAQRMLKTANFAKIPKA